MRKLMVLVIALCSLTFAFGQPKPKIAVLDALIEEGVDPAARVPVTEKIIEALVASGQYAVLDRSNVQQVLEEKKFQLSGIVQDSEIKQAGVFLGADYVCVSKVSKLGRTYFVSGKIIDVVTGQIEAQISKERQGEIDVILGLARDIGVALSGGTVEPLPVQVVDGSDLKREPDPKNETPVADRLGPRSRLVASYLLPAFIGTGAEIVDAYVSQYVADAGGSYGAYDTRNFGIAVQMLQPMFSIFYASISGSFLTRTDSSEYFFFSPDTDEYIGNYRLLDLSMAFGVVSPIRSTLQAYGGIGTGLLVMTLVDEFWENSLTESSTGFFVEAGIDLLLLNRMVLNAGVSLRLAELGGDDYDSIFTNEQTMGFIQIGLGGGVAF